MAEFITVNGATLAYAITGPTSAPLMITLHGGRGMGMYLPHSLVSNQPSDKWK
jgi:poly(3-hydroxybutyrate) depolymerase